MTADKTLLTCCLLLIGSIVSSNVVQTPARAADTRKPKPGSLEEELKSAGIPIETDDEGNIVAVTLGSKTAPLSLGNLKLVGKIKTLTKIRSDASFDSMTSDKLAAISAIKTLESLQLDSCSFQGADLKKLATLPKLTTLHLIDSTIDDNGARGISTIKTLTVLKIDGNQISDAGLKALSNLKELNELILSKNLEDRLPGRSQPITDNGLAALKGMKQLKTLDLSGNMITDNGLKTLAGIKTLEKLNIADTKVTAMGIAKFKEALPECFVSTKAGAFDN